MSTAQDLERQFRREVTELAANGEVSDTAFFDKIADLALPVLAARARDKLRTCEYCGRRATGSRLTAGQRVWHCDACE